MRRIAQLLPAAAILIAVACSGNLSEEQIEARAQRAHEQAWVADTHLDSPLHVRDPEWSASDRHSVDERGGGCWDIPRMIEGDVDAVFLAVYTGQGPLTDEGYASAHARAIAAFDWVHAQAEASPDAELALTVADARRLESEGKRAIFIGVENGYPIGPDLANVEDFFNRGMRYMTLSHSSDNQICASSTHREEREDFGLTDYGRRVVAEMNRLGVIIDCSHVSDQTFFDVADISTAPVIASHSAADGINEHGRNFSDEMLYRLAEIDGCIQLIPLGSFIRGEVPNPERDAAMAELQERYSGVTDPTEEQQQEIMQEMRALRRQYPTPPATIDDFIKHIDYVVNLIGIDHVGFGSDFDGGGGVEGLRDISMLPNLSVELVRRGYSTKDLEKFWGGNLLRVLGEVERAAER